MANNSGSKAVKCGKANVTVGGAEAAAADSDLRRAFTALRAHCGGGVRDAVRAGARLRIRLAGLGGAHAGKTGGSAHGDALKATVKAKALPGDATALLRAMPDHRFEFRARPSRFHRCMGAG